VNHIRRKPGPICIPQEFTQLLLRKPSGAGAFGAVSWQRSDRHPTVGGMIGE
jgi:hypothetical protein